MLLLHILSVFKTKSPFLKKEVGISTGEGFLISRSFMTIFMVPVDISG